MILLRSKICVHFYDSLEFCSNMFFSEIAVLSNNETAQEVIKEFTTSECGGWIFSGFTDRETEGVFVNTYTGESLGWNNWVEGEPNNIGGNEDCAVYDANRGGSYDVPCEDKYLRPSLVRKLIYYTLYPSVQEISCYVRTFSRNNAVIQKPMNHIQS